MESADEGYRTVTLPTPAGSVEARHYPAAGSVGAVWVGGVGGGFDTPARGLYPRLCADLTGHGIQSLRVRFRFPTRLDEAVADALAGLDFLAAQGVTRAAVIGHSFGGAVAIRAAAARPGLVRTVVTLATQGYGADVARGLAIPLLLIHGEADEVLAPECSMYVHRIAREPKALVLMPGAGHCLDETAEAVCREVRDWLTERL
ncbi:alpha/beta fold hydrolase [Azospirillum sp. TSO22-1]|uniref:alpha/beta hydrolase n=1 Tax=Azospirillum sp. TSO22-1 TaxID=716789 RepID=UPI000D60B97A|nr:alpha/beta fold hydrolase [Azospirillum sp. TSO22-1]PWC55943.1 dienelactone hydrolase [Azospirillum sp. TSO22-1]